MINTVRRGRRDKKDMERSVVNEFIEQLRSPFSSYFIGDEEKPDFVLKADQQFIGIELTQHIWHDINGYNPMALHHEKNKLVDEVEKAVIPFLKGNIWVDIDIDQSFIWDKIERDVVYQFLVETIIDISQQFDYSEPYEAIDSNPWTLPKGVRNVHVYHHHAVQETLFYQHGAYMVPSANPEDVQAIVKSKDHKKVHYRYLDEYWLIIWNTGISPSDFTKVQDLRRIKYKTNFTRLFYFQMGRDIITELETEAPEEAP